MKKRKKNIWITLRYGTKEEKCPICKSRKWHYVSYSEEYWGTVEQHGYCERCGYIVEQAYSKEMLAFVDTRKGYKLENGKYIEKNEKRHRRIRKKLEITGIDINPEWANYI